MSTQRRIYLDQAATSWPKLPAAVEAADKYLQDCGATSGRGAYASARHAERWVTAARHNLARLLGARDAADVAFCSSGTHALNATISGLLRPGQVVWTTAIEHNSVLRPVEHWRKVHGVQVNVATCDERGLVALPEFAADNIPQLIIVSHASNVSGRIQDLSAWSRLARQHEAILVVDASQSVGYVPIDMQSCGIDVLVSAGHKGLGALGGSGFIVARPEIQSQFEPLMWGGTGTASEQLDFEPAWPQSIEVGNLNLTAIVSMAAAAEHWLRDPLAMGSWRTALEHFLVALRQRFQPEQLRLVGHDEPGKNLPVVSCLPENWDVHEAAAVLDANFGIEVRAGFHCAALVHRPLGSHDRGGTLRLSLGHATTLVELDDTVHALSALI